MSELPDGSIDIAGKVRFTPHPVKMPGWQQYGILQPGEYAIEALGGGKVNLSEISWVYVPEPPPLQTIQGGEPRLPAYEP